MNEKVIRYEPVEAIRWLKLGAEQMRRDAKERGAEVVRREGARTISKDLTQAASAIFGMGKSAVTDLLHANASFSEYLFDSLGVEISRATGSKRILYSAVKRIIRVKDGYNVVLDRGNFEITPYAHIVASRIRAPLGWRRNGLEVPFETIIDELAGRCGVEVQDE